MNLVSDAETAGGRGILSPAKAKAGESFRHGANVIKGNAGRMAGLAFRGFAAYEVLSFAGKIGSHMAGEAYDSMVESADRLKRRTGSDHMMSGGYFNTATSTERQRAVQAMNENSLHPRSQMMGNEAYWMHN